jgi:hypothetical protein
LTALSPADTLVTVGVGGNDIGWSAVIKRCVELDILPVGRQSLKAADPCDIASRPGPVRLPTGRSG